MINILGQINLMLANLVGKRKSKPVVNKNLTVNQSKAQAYDKILTRQEYQTKFPNFCNDNHLVCRDCQSQDIKEWGLTSRDDEKRVHSCSHCGQVLWRSEK